MNFANARRWEDPSVWATVSDHQGGVYHVVLCRHVVVRYGAHGNAVRYTKIKSVTVRTSNQETK
jgi:hypothetical protein